MRSALFVFAVACCVAAPLPAAATAMSLGDAVSYALDHSPTIAQKVAAATQAEHMLAQARGNAFPTVTGQLQNTSSKSSNFQGAYGIIGSSQQSVFSQNTAQIGTNYNLNLGGLSLLQLASAKASAAQAREDLASAEDQLATTVTSAYYAVMQKQALVTVDEADLAYQNALVRAATVKEKAGVAAGVDVLKAQVAQTKSASTLVAARADVQNATETLAQTIGASLDQTFSFPKTIGEPPLPKGSAATLESIALHVRPDVQAAQDALTAAQLTRKGFDRELFPQVQIGASFGNQLSPTNVSYGEKPGCTPLGSPACLMPLPRVGNPGFWALSATTTFSLPLVDYGQRHTERLSDDAAVTSARQTLKQARTQVEIDVRQSYRAAQTALAQLAFAKRESELGTESARIAQLQYARGLIALADVIQTQQQSVSAQNDLVDAQIAYVNAIVKLRVSTGTYDAQRAVADL